MEFREKEARLRILVTGGAGYIGSVLVPKLLEEGHAVTVVDWFVHRENSLAACCKYRNFDVYRADCRDLSQYRRHIRGADCIIPLAALVGAPLCNANPVDARLLNLDSHLELIKALSPQQFVVMPNTESLYGKSGDVCREDETPTNALSTYAAHKAEVERVLLERGNCVSLRLATVFGMSPRMRLDLLVNDFTWRALKDRAFVVFQGGYRRTCIHVQDVARAFIHALTLKGVYNVGAVVTTKLSLCDAIKEQLPDFTYVEAEYATDPDQRDYIVSDEKIRRTGFAPEWTLKMGITELLKGYRALSNARYTNN